MQMSRKIDTRKLNRKLLVPKLPMSIEFQIWKCRDARLLPRLMTWVMGGLVTVTMIALTERAKPAQAAASPPEVNPQEVSFRSGDVTLHGTIWAPIGAEHSLPGVVLVSGSGPGPRVVSQLEA